MVETDDALMVKAGMRWGQKALGYLQNGQAAESGKDYADIEVPACEVHGIPMVRQQGRFGAF